MSIDDLKSLMDAFDPAVLLPELNSIMDVVTAAMRLAVVAGPVILLILGLAYIFLAPKEANYYFGYRCYFGMGSVEAWRYTQRIAGLIWAALGLVLSVVMFLLSSGFVGKEIHDVLYLAMTCILWEVGLVVISCLAINTLVMVNFTAAGDLRRKRK